MDNDIKNQIQQGIKDFMNSAQYGITKIQSHLHNGMDTNQVDIKDILRFPKIATNGQTITFNTTTNQWEATTITTITTKAGKIASAGTAGSVFPTGWTVSKTATGQYTVVHNLGSTAYAVVANPVDVSGSVVTIGINSNSFVILITDLSGSATDSATDFIFSQ